MTYLMLALLMFLPSARAIQDVTHTAKLGAALLITNKKGKTDQRTTLEGKVSMSWESGDCEFAAKKATYLCKFDVSQDLLGPSGEILVKSLPKIHFDSQTIHRMLIDLGVAGHKSDASRSQGFDVPWYVLRDDVAMKLGEGPKLWSGFAGLYVDLDVSRTDSLRFHLYELKAKKGAFDIIGNNGVGNFGN